MQGAGRSRLINRLQANVFTLALPDSSGVDSRLHLHLVSRGEDVGARPLAQLTGQLLGTGKVEFNVTCMNRCG